MMMKLPQNQLLRIDENVTLFSIVHQSLFSDDHLKYFAVCRAYIPYRVS
jgi:hypothetical protein